MQRAAKAPKAPLKAPADLLDALRKNKKAHAAFGAFSPSAQRDYIEWITEAKSEATRMRRLETAVAWIEKHMGRAAYELVVANQGAVARNLQLITKILDNGQSAEEDQSRTQSRTFG